MAGPQELFTILEGERDKRLNMIDVPLAMIIPRHARLKLGLEMCLQLVNCASKVIDGRAVLVEAFGC